MLRRAHTSILAIAVATASCVAHTSQPAAPGQAYPATRARATAAFAYHRSEIPYKNHVLDDEESRDYLVRHIRFPSIGDNGQSGNLVTGHYYQSKHVGKKPLVIILPLWGGHPYPSRRMTDYLRRRSAGQVHIFNMLGEKNLTDWDRLLAATDEEAFLATWGRITERQRNTVIDIRRTIDWAAARPEIDSERIAVVAFSRAALIGALVLTSDDRVTAAALVMGGAAPHEALAKCRLLFREGAQRKAREEFGWTPDEFADRLAPLYRDLDPATYPGRVDPGGILLVEARDDGCFPAASRLSFYEALGRPERIVIPAGHKMAFLAMTPLGGSWLQQRIWKFLDRAL